MVHSKDDLEVVGEGAPLGDGRNLVEVLAELTGFNETHIENELQQVMQSPDTNLNHLTLEQLRETLAAYLDLVQSEFLAAMPTNESENS